MSESDKKTEEDLSAQLVEMTYATTTDPYKFFEYLEFWEKYLSTLPEHSQSDSDGIQKNLVHFERALEIFDAMGRQARVRDRNEVMIELLPQPAVICDARGRVLQANPIAQREYDIRDTEDFRLPDSVCDTIADWPSDVPSQFVALGDGEDMLRHWAIVFRRKEPSLSFLVVFEHGGQQPAVMEGLKRQFGLTQAETDLLSLLIKGHSTEQISNKRGITINTTRKHIRNILEKTGASGMTDLVRVCLSLSAQHETALLAQTAVDQDPIHNGHDELPHVLPDGRVMYFREHGDPNGRPILMYHGMLSGTQLPKKVIEMAKASRWRIIAPSRPGFGRSDPLQKEEEALIEQTTVDVLNLLDRLGVDRFLIWTTLSACCVGVHLAEAADDRCVGVLTVCGSGLIDDDSIESMAKNQRVMAKTYKRSKTAFRLMVRGALAVLDLRGMEFSLGEIWKYSKADIAATKDPELSMILKDALNHATRQGWDAFAKDAYAATKDSREIIQRLLKKMPVTTIQGSEFNYIPHDTVQRLVGQVPGYQFITAEGYGQSAYLTYFPEIFVILHGMWSDKNRSGNLPYYQK